MKRVLLLWAAPTSTNLGVRALAEGTAALVRRVAPDAELLSQSYGQGSAPVNIGVGRTLARELALDSRGLRSWVKGFDLVVDTRAGDSFADIYGLPRLGQLCSMAEFVRVCGVPLVLGPQTIGPFDHPLGRILARYSLWRADGVLARDSASAAAAVRLGRPVDALTTDVVFAMTQPTPSGDADVLLNVSGLLWTSDTHGPATRYQDTVRRVIGGLIERGRSVTLVSHVLDSGFPDNDEPTSAALADEFGLAHLVPGSLEEFRSIAKGAKLVVGSRMHACLNSLSVGTPAIPLAYSRKFAPLLADLGWSHVVDLNAANDPANQLLSLINEQSEEFDSQLVQLRTEADRLLLRAEDALREYL